MRGRTAWSLFGDPQARASPLESVLQPAAIRSAAGQIAKAVAKQQPLPVRTTSRPDQGTIHLSAADREGNLVAVTLTHGGSVRRRVTVPGLGLTLGHGMSRFDPHAGHPNAPGPHKRPLNNMCPTIVAKNGRSGKSPSALAAAARFPMPSPKSCCSSSPAASRSRTPSPLPRLHTEGQLALSFERTWPAAPLAELKATRLPNRHRRQRHR